MLRVEPQIKATYVASGQVSMAFSHILDLGAGSHLAHRTAECAGQQQPLAFWQMHDLLFERQAQVWNATPALLLDWAAEVGLDRQQMALCLDDPATAAKIERMDQERRAAGIRIRPSFKLNDTLLEGALPYEYFVEKLTELGVK